MSDPINRFVRFSGSLVALFGFLWLSFEPAPGLTGVDDTPYDVAAGWKQAPYGDKVSAVFSNYSRASPYIGTAGVVRGGGFEEAKALGFKTIINLNTAQEGAEEEAEAVMAAGLSYVSIPVSGLAPVAEQVSEFAQHVRDPNNYPILVHCVSANRVGAIWALYRAAAGVPAEIAVQEGRTVGLKPSREVAVRRQLGLPELK